MLNDSELNYLYKEKERVLAYVSPIILFNLTTGELKYVIESDTLKKIDNLIEDRLGFLKKKI